MVVRVASRILSPDAYARVETRLLPQPGEHLDVPTERGRVTFTVHAVEQAREAEPVLRVMVCEGQVEDAHYRRPLDDLFAVPLQPSLSGPDAPFGL